MLGTFNQSVKYKSVEDFKSLSDYFHYFFDGVNGYVYSCGKCKNRDGLSVFYNNGVNLNTLDFDDLGHSRRFSDIESRVCYDRYMTLNTFTYVKSDDGKPNLARRVENTKRLNALYVDIDCYNVGMNPEEVIYELTYNLRSYKIPQWTFLIKSGQGVYIVWKLRNEDGYVLQNRQRWQAIEHYLCSQLASLGADTKATDCSRVLRIPFSYNSKNGAQVFIDSFCDVSYSLYELCYDYVPEIYEKSAKSKSTNRKLSSRMIFCADKIAESLGVDSPSTSSDFKKVWCFINDNKSLIKERSVKYSVTGSIPAYRAKCCAENANDIERLMSLRYAEEHGHREVALFLYRLMLMWAFEDAEIALKRTLELNATFSIPLDEKTVIVATESAERHYKRYNVSRSYISEMLSITLEESEALSFLPPNGCKRKPRPKNGDGATRAKNNRAYYVRTLENDGKSLKKDKLSIRRAKLSELVSLGYDCASLCSLLGVSRATLYRDLAFLGLSLSEASHNYSEASEGVSEGVDDCDNEMDNSVNNSIFFPFSFFKTSTIISLNEVPFALDRPWGTVVFWIYLDNDGGVPPP